MSRIAHTWIVAGMVSSAARFVPIPLVDDLIQTQCRKFAIANALSSHDSDIQLSDLKPLYGGNSGCVAGCLGMVAKLPLKLILYPIRKIVVIVTSVHGVPTEILRVVLLARTTDRYLEKAEKQRFDAVRLRAAYDATFKRMDLRTANAAIADAVSGVREWKDAAVSVARRMYQSSGDPVIRNDDNLETAASNIDEALNRPTLANLFSEFDERLDLEYESLFDGQPLAPIG